MCLRYIFLKQMDYTGFRGLMLHVKHSKTQKIKNEKGKKKRKRKLRKNSHTYWNNQSRVCFFKFSLQPKEILVTSPDFKFTRVKFPTRCLQKVGENNSASFIRQKTFA